MEGNIILKCFFIIVHFLIKFIELYVSYHSCLTNTTIGTAKKTVVPINCFMTTAHAAGPFPFSCGSGAGSLPRWPLGLHQLDGLFTRDVVDGQFQHTQWRPFPVDGAVAVGRVVIRGIFEGQRFNGGAFFSVVLQNAHGAKHNDAAEWEVYSSGTI